MPASGDASIFSSLYEFYKRSSDADMTDEWSSNKKPDSGGGGGGAGKSASTKGSSIRGGKASVKSYHQGQHFSSSKINAIVKVSYARSNRDAARHIIQHAAYLQERERGPFEKEREFFNRERDHVERPEVVFEMLENRGRDAAMFKVILSPNNNDLDRKELTREVMERFEYENDTKLHWVAIEHENTHHYHVHILIAGRDEDGHSLRISPIQIEQLRQIAKEYQFELQYEYLNDRELMAKELEFFREHIHNLTDAQIDRDMQIQLGIYNPELDEKVRDELLNIDPKFDRDLQEEFGFDKYFDLSKEFADVNKELEREDAQIFRDLQYTNPELFPHLSREDKDHEPTLVELDNSLYDRESQDAQRENPEHRLEDNFLIGTIPDGPELDRDFQRIADELTGYYGNAYPTDIEHAISEQASFEAELSVMFGTEDPAFAEVTDRDQDAFEMFWDSQNFDAEQGEDLTDVDWTDEHVYEDTTEIEVELDEELELDDDDPI